MELASAAPHAATTGLDVVVSSVASDSHTWNLIFLQLLLEELGHRVTNLGACVPDQLLVEHCRDRRPDLVVISSVNGHGAVDGRRVVARLRAEPELAGLPVVIGGKLGISGAGNRRHVSGLLQAGFDAVFDDSTGLGAFHSFVGALPTGRPRLPGAERRSGARELAGARDLSGALALTAAGAGS
ncbi:methylaspartate mutase sigma subunit [Streptacidiphilus sp. MAP12-33]|uniref:cobalamin B12-binding domain-containing protein n=1 Tax=Streptacidiphilus sp. MAP12-33 TaxID=3156266 RepID=UPI003519AACD